MFRLFYFAPFALLLVFGIIAYVQLARGQHDDLPSVFIGQNAPKIQLEPFEELAAFTSDDLAGGQVSLVNFWASWCAPCRAEHPNLQALANQNVPIYGVNYKDNPANAQAFLNELGNPFTKGGADPQARMGADWGVYGLPETFVIGPNGTVLLRVAGPLTQRTLKGRILPALEEKNLRLLP